LVHRQTKKPCLFLKIIAAIIIHSRQENQARFRQFLHRNSYRFSGNEMLLQKQVLPKGNFFDQKLERRFSELVLKLKRYSKSCRKYWLLLSKLFPESFTLVAFSDPKFRLGRVKEQK